MIWKDLTWAKRFDIGCHAALVVTVFSLPFPSAGFGFAGTLFIVLWLLSGDFRTKLTRILRTPPVLIPVALYGLLVLGTTYSSAPDADMTKWLGKYEKLLYPALVVGVLYRNEWRRRAINAFLYSVILVMVLSYAKWFGLLPPNAFASGPSVIAKYHILHSILMAIAVYFMAVLVHASPRARWWLAIPMVLAAYNLLFMIPGRAGYLVLAVLLVMFLFRNTRRRYWLVGSALIVVSCLLVYEASPLLKQKVDEGVAEVQSFDASKPDPTSLGRRLETYHHTWTLIKKHPLFGGGTASWTTEYRAIASPRGLEMLPDPHSDYLAILSQLGAAGLFVFLAMLWFFWTYAGRLPEVEAQLARGLTVAMGITSLFNTSLLYAHESKVYLVMLGVLLAGGEKTVWWDSKPFLARFRRERNRGVPNKDQAS
jgi:O-antigen ligase